MNQYVCVMCDKKMCLFSIVVIDNYKTALLLHRIDFSVILLKVKINYDDTENP